GSDLKIYLGNGDATFQAGASYHLPVSGATSVVIGDFTGHGLADIVAVDAGRTPPPPPFIPAGLNLLVGNGDGPFRDPLRTDDPLAFLCQSLVAVDLRHDGLADLVYLDHDNQRVYVQLNNGDGTFQAPRNYSTGDLIGALAVTDFNGDGNADLLISY